MAILKATQALIQSSPNFEQLIYNYFDFVDMLDDPKDSNVIIYHVEGQGVPKGEEAEILVTFIRAGNKIIIKNWKTVEETIKDRERIINPDNRQLNRIQ